MGRLRHLTLWFSKSSQRRGGRFLCAVPHHPRPSQDRLDAHEALLLLELLLQGRCLSLLARIATMPLLISVQPQERERAPSSTCTHAKGIIIRMDAAFIIIHAPDLMAPYLRP